MSPLSAPAATLLAALLVSVVSLASDLAGLSAGDAAEWAVFLGHHAYATAQALGLSVPLAVGAGLLARRGPTGARGAALGILLVALLAAALGLAVLPEDVALQASRMPPLLKPIALRRLLSVGWALAIPLALALGLALRRTRLRLLVAAASLGLIFQHARYWPELYPGLHLLAVLAAGAALAASLTGLPCPAAAVRTPTTRAAALALAALAGLAGFGLPPSPGVRSSLAHSTTAVLAEYALRLHSLPLDQPAALTAAEAPWYAPRAPGSFPAKLPVNAPASLPANAPGSAPPVVVLVTIDCLRFDVAHDAELLAGWPALAALGRTAVDFTDAHTPAPATAPALSAIFTGKYYSQLIWKPKSDGRVVRLWPATDRSVRFPALLGAQGVRTVFFAPEVDLKGPWGVSAGFQETTLPGQGWAPELVDAALAWLSHKPAAPAFVAMHMLDPHWPYVRGGEADSPKAGYLLEVGLVDRALTTLFNGLDALGLSERAVVIVTADHGEAFGEHGSKYHGANLYEIVERVPLWIRGPGFAPRAEPTPVSNIDLGPTILAIFGQETPHAFLGESLLPLLRGEPAHLTRPILAESGRRMRAHYFPDGLKLTYDLRKQSIELFDLHADPEERHNVFNPDDPDHLGRLAKLKAFFEAHEARQAGYETPYRP